MHQMLVNIFLMGKEFKGKSQMQLALADFYYDCGYSDTSDIPEKVESFQKEHCVENQVFTVDF